MPSRKMDRAGTSLEVRQRMNQASSRLVPATEGLHRGVKGFKL